MYYAALGSKAVNASFMWDICVNQCLQVQSEVCDVTVP